MFSTLIEYFNMGGKIQGGWITICVMAMLLCLISISYVGDVRCVISTYTCIWTLFVV